MPPKSPADCRLAPKSRRNRKDPERVNLFQRQHSVRGWFPVQGMLKSGKIGQTVSMITCSVFVRVVVSCWPNVAGQGWIGTGGAAECDFESRRSGPVRSGGAADAKVGVLDAISLFYPLLELFGGKVFFENVLGVKVILTE